MSGGLLTDAERQSVIKWLELSVSTSQGLITQLEKLGPYTAPMVEKEKLEAAAALVILQKLKATEVMSIGIAVETAPKEVLEAEAARYRWLRDVSVPPHNFYLSVPVEFHGVRYTPAEVDAAIDAAMNRKDKI